MANSQTDTHSPVYGGARPNAQSDPVRALASKLRAICVATIVGAYDCIYGKFGWRIKERAIHDTALTFSAVYFTDCAKKLYDGSDEYLATHYNAALALADACGKRFHPLDLLDYVATVTTTCLHKIKVSNLLDGNADRSMERVRERVIEYIQAIGFTLADITATHIGWEQDITYAVDPKFLVEK